MSIEEQNMDNLGRYIEQFREEWELYEDFVSKELEIRGDRLKKFLDTAPYDLRWAVAMELERDIREEYVYKTIFLYSLLIYISWREEYLLKLLRYVRARKELRKNTRFFLYYQIKTLMFTYPQCDTPAARYEKWMLFQEVYKEFEQDITQPLDYIPVEERNSNLIVLITEQVLSEEHAPTRTALERCAACKKYLGSQVLLINTAEAGSSIGSIPFFDTRVTFYDDKKKDMQALEWGGEEIPFFQCEKNMPRIDTLELLLQQIRSLKPRHIITLGGNSILANLANRMIPVLSIGLGFSELEAAATDYQTLGRQLREEDLNLLRQCGKSEGHVIETTFTFDLKPQERIYTRQMRGIGKDKFVMIVVGSRLNAEVSNEFLRMLETSLKENDQILFVGSYKRYDQDMRCFPRLAAHSVYLGFETDVLALMECCDLYVNPTRKGGGASAVEALVKGVPVVTTAYGDVACNAGQEYIVKDYQEMTTAIERYRSDTDFYERQSEKARERAKMLMDSEAAFRQLMEEFEKREAEAEKEIVWQ